MQFSKVEICGVNTSKLKVLNESEKKALLKLMHDGTPEQKKTSKR